MQNIENEIMRNKPLVAEIGNSKIPSEILNKLDSEKKAFFLKNEEDIRRMSKDTGISLEVLVTLDTKNLFFFFENNGEFTQLIKKTNIFIEKLIRCPLKIMAIFLKYSHEVVDLITIKKISLNKLMLLDLDDLVKVLKEPDYCSKFIEENREMSLRRELFLLALSHNEVSASIPKISAEKISRLETSTCQLACASLSKMFPISKNNSKEYKSEKVLESHPTFYSTTHANRRSP